MVRRVHRKKDIYTRDPWVPIDPACLRAAIGAAGWSVQKLAKEVGHHSQTLDHLVKGDRAKRCRAGRRRDLAQRLGVPGEWLGGLGTAVPEIARVPRELSLRLSPRLQLAIGGLLRKAEAALHRDLSDLQTPQQHKGIGVTETMLRDYLWWWLFDLTTRDWWRVQLTTWRPPAVRSGVPEFLTEAPGVLRDHPGWRSTDEDAAGLAMVTVLEAALDPWFEGEARLDYDRFRVLAGYDRVGRQGEPSHPRYEGRQASPLHLIPQIALDEVAQ